MRRYAEKNLGLYVWGDVSMRTTMRQQNRWFSAVAMTCLSGFALCGCTRGSREMSSNLTENAAREAIDAERHIAERKRQGAPASKPKDLVASEERPASPNRNPRTLSKSAPASKKWNSGTDKSNSVSREVAGTPSKSAKLDRVQLEENELETADWAEGDLDRRVKAVSDSQEQESDVEAAEPLLNSPLQGPIASDLFEEEAEAIVRMKKTETKGRLGSPAEKTNLTPARPKQASFDGKSEHPWAKKSPVAARSEATYPSTGKDLKADEPVVQESADMERLVPEDPRQSESKARVHTLLTQAKSLLNKGEFRSAYRVAQLAQRIADSEDLFFVAGEEQPADIVRSVLLKIRIDENRVASLTESTPDQDLSVDRQEPSSSPTIERSRSNLPEAWSFAEWRTGPDPRKSKQTPIDTMDAAWVQAESEPAQSSSMRIIPQPSQNRGAHGKKEFPNSRPEWRSTANEPLSLSSSTEVGAPGIATAKDGRRLPKVVQADLDASSTAELETASALSAGGPILVPRPFPSKNLATDVTSEPQEMEVSESESLAVVDDWRSQSLTDLAVNRQPLLVAPLPPEKLNLTDSLVENLDDSFATDIQEPLNTPKESKLWMMLAAAAGAFAMLFVRRRPVPVVRSNGDVR